MFSFDSLHPSQQPCRDPGINSHAGIQEFMSGGGGGGGGGGFNPTKSSGNIFFCHHLVLQESNG